HEGCLSTLNVTRVGWKSDEVGSLGSAAGAGVAPVGSVYVTWRSIVAFWPGSNTPPGSSRLIWSCAPFALLGTDWAVAPPSANEASRRRATSLTARTSAKGGMNVA